MPVSAVLAFLASSLSAASPALVAIPGGTFRMGSLDGDADERPVRQVAVAPFEMGRTEVTIGEYLRCMADAACSPPDWWDRGYSEETAPLRDEAKRMALPVTGVSWDQARQYCRWLGKGYDLPTEAEWEYAAGGAFGLAYPWGNDPAGDRRQRLHRKLSPVGSDSASSFGLFGMAGNAWEWTRDCYDPPVGSDTSCSRRSARGGSWSEHIWNLRLSNRSFGLAKQGYKGLGFRIVRHAE